MLDSVSWSQYLIYLSIFLSIYYAIVGSILYRKEIAGVIFNRSDANEEQSFSITEQRLLNDIIELHDETVYRDIPKEELVLNLKMLVQQSKSINIRRIDEFIRETFKDWGEQDYRRIIQ